MDLISIFQPKTGRKTAREMGEGERQLDKKALYPKEEQKGEKKNLRKK